VHPHVENASNSDAQTAPLAATLVLAVGSRVCLDSHLAPNLGLCKFGTGTVLGFLYPDDAECQPNLSTAEAIAVNEQPQLPIVIVQMDARWYVGNSTAAWLHAFLPSIDATTPNVVPIAPVLRNVRFGSRTYQRRQLPLRLATATTVHAAQGTTQEFHVMSPTTTSRPTGHCRGLTYVGFSRSKCLLDLFLTSPITAAHFMGYDAQRADIVREYRRLRRMPSPLTDTQLQVLIEAYEEDVGVDDAMDEAIDEMDFDVAEEEDIDDMYE
jgi:hypothetical protein